MQKKEKKTKISLQLHGVQSTIVPVNQVSLTHRKIFRSKIIIIIHNILHLIKLTTLYINTSEHDGKRSEDNATLAHLEPPLKWLLIIPKDF